MARYDVGDLVRCSVLFRDIAGAPADPTTVVFKHETPAAVETTVTYPTGIVKVTTGSYYYDLTITEAGTWSIRWNATGAVVAAGEKELVVAPTVFA
jgi:hypothetical protein